MMKVSSSDNISKEVIFVTLVELQLFYVDFEMGLNSYGQAAPSSETMLCFISAEDPNCAGLYPGLLYPIGPLLYL